MNSWPWRGDCRDWLDEKRQCLGLPKTLRPSQRTQRPERTGSYGVRGGSAQRRLLYLRQPSSHAVQDLAMGRRKRQGLNVTSQTLWDQIDKLADHVETTYLGIKH